MQKKNKSKKKFLQHVLNIKRKVSMIFKIKNLNKS